MTQAPPPTLCTGQIASLANLHKKNYAQLRNCVCVQDVVPRIVCHAPRCRFVLARLRKYAEQSSRLSRSPFSEPPQNATRDSEVLLHTCIGDHTSRVLHLAAFYVQDRIAFQCSERLCLFACRCVFFFVFDRASCVIISRGGLRAAQENMKKVNELTNSPPPDDAAAARGGANTDMMELLSSMVSPSSRSNI